ncbi:MAG: hypothetical protein ACOH10_07780 [Rhodoglobus sp.]
MTDLGYSGHAATGAKYDKTQYQTATGIAKGVRADIKVAVAEGTLPGKDAGFKYSVRSQQFAGGQSVSINIVGPGGEAWAFRPITDSQQDARAAEYGVTKVFTDEARRWGEVLNGIGNAYTYRDVDSQIDYFDVSCYINVYCGAGGLCL